MNRSDLPNLISVARIILVAPVVWLIIERELTAALVLFLIAGASDGLDGYLAKHYGWTSRLGTILDPVADKLLLTCSYLALWWIEMLPLWLVAAIIIRDIVIVGGAMAYHVVVGRYDMAPTLVSKLNTGAQIVMVLAVLADPLLPLTPAMLTVFAYVVLVTTIISGVDYVWTWGARAWREHADRRRERHTKPRS